MSLKQNIRFHSALLTPAVIVVLLVSYLFFSSVVSIVFTLFCFAALGGITTTYLRLRDLPTIPSPALDDDSRRLAILQVYISPFVAGLFGVVLYMALCSKIVTGPLFPNFLDTTTPPNNILEPFYTSKLATPVDAAKLCVWAFIAGFAEKLVPNIIDRLVAETDKEPTRSAA